MSQQWLDALRERLLRRGIAPRHVRRYVAELRDHFDDLVREEMVKGLARSAAEDAARARIGSDDALVAVMVAHPERRSLTARHPWAVFGFGPVLLLTLVVAAAFFIQGGLIFLSPTIPAWSVAWVKFSFNALNWLATYAAPLAVAGVLCFVGVRQRITTHWIVFGLAIACIGGGFHEIGVKWSNVPTQPSELDISFALAPPFPLQMIVSGLFRAAINLALASVIYWLWTRRNYPAVAE